MLFKAPQLVRSRAETRSPAPSLREHSRQQVSCMGTWSSAFSFSPLLLDTFWLLFGIQGLFLIDGCITTSPEKDIYLEGCSGQQRAFPVGLGTGPRGVSYCSVPQRCCPALGLLC